MQFPGGCTCHGDRSLSCSLAADALLQSLYGPGKGVLVSTNLLPHGLLLLLTRPAARPTHPRSMLTKTPYLTTVGAIIQKSFDVSTKQKKKKKGQGLLLFHPLPLCCSACRLVGEHVKDVVAMVHCPCCTVLSLPLHICLSIFMHICTVVRILVYTCRSQALLPAQGREGSRGHGGIAGGASGGRLHAGGPEEGRQGRGEERSVIAVDGGLYENYTQYRGTLVETLNGLLGKEAARM